MNGATVNTEENHNKIAIQKGVYQMSNEKIIQMIDEYLEEPHSIHKDWVEALQTCRQALIDNKKKDIEINILIRKNETLKDEVAEKDAEIVRLKKTVVDLNTNITDLILQKERTKSEAIKEFAERLKNCFCVSAEYLDIMGIIDNITVEMVGGINE